MSEPVAKPIDADVDLHDAVMRNELRPSPWPVLAMISVGGVVGTLPRYGLQEMLPHRPDHFGWATFAINVSGCLLVGCLMVIISEAWGGRRLLRPFLGVGVLGGFTTFSTYIIDIHQAIAAGAVWTAMLYLAGTLAVALAAVWAGAAFTGWVVHARRRRAQRRRAGVLG